MLFFYTVSKLRKGLSKCNYGRFHTSPKYFKWPSIIQTDGSTPLKTTKTVKIWNNMTIWDLAKSLKKDLDYVENVLKPKFKTEYDQLDGRIYDLTAIKDFLMENKLKFSIIEPLSNPVSLIKRRKNEISSVHSEDAEKNKVKRPPIVTIMGHVDHGKTTLLDALRNSNIVESEFGGITQHIGAFSVSLTPGNSVTFIDTPGHAAFKSMRNRGAEITDIVVLIVAADDGVMDQTVESIKMAKNAGVNILVAVNKIDKAPSVNLRKIKEELLREGIQAEDLGGQVQVIPISALKRQNLDKLIEAILTEADMMALTGDPNGPFEGIVIESFIGKVGKLATVIVKRGTLRKQAILLAGVALGRVRAIYSVDGVELSEVTLSQPARVSGWRDLPRAGDRVIQIPKEKDARMYINQEKRNQLLNKQRKDFQAIQEKALQSFSEYNKRKETLLELKIKRDIEGLKEAYLRKGENKIENHCKLNIIVKGDVDGSTGAILNVINTYDRNDICELKVVHSGVGKLTVSDLELAEVFDATVYCFNLPFPNELKSEITEKGIKIKFHTVIYKLMDDLKEEISSILRPVEEEVVIGNAEVLQHFTITADRAKLSAAGCVCVTGELRKDLLYKVFRDNNAIFDGKLKSMKHFKNEVNIIKKGTQCGIILQNFNEEFKTGDKIICYTTQLQYPPLNWDPGF